MKIHLVWLCVSVGALFLGTRFAKQEVRIIEKPVEIVRTKEVFVDRPATKGTPNEGRAIALATEYANEKYSKLDLTQGEPKATFPVKSPYTGADAWVVSYRVPSPVAGPHTLGHWASLNVWVRVDDVVDGAIVEF